MSTVQLRIGVDVGAFAEALARVVFTGRTNVVDAVESVLRAQLAGNAFEQIAERLVKPIVARVHPHYFKQRFANLRTLADTGYQTWYPELHFATRHADAVENLHVEAQNVRLGTIKFGDGREPTHRFTVKRLKTQTNHVVRLNELHIPAAIFRVTINRLETGDPIPQPLIANLALGPGNRGYRLVSFDDLLTGVRRFCQCSQSAHERMRSSAAQLVSSFAAGSWPHQVIELLSNPIYEPRLCHLCTAVSDGTEAASQRYGDFVIEGSGPYVDQLMLTNGLDERTARAEVQGQLGLSKWIREAEMFRLVKLALPDRIVYREASPPWLGRLRLDVYVPELGVAIEHQGRQHYEALNVFGGEAAFRRTVERDAEKRRLCKDNGVAVVEIRYDESLTLRGVRHRLRRFVADRARGAEEER